MPRTTLAAGVMAALHMATFPGALSPQPLFGGEQAVGWIFLAWRGGLLVRFDANRRSEGIVGWYSEQRGRKYAKGPTPPRLGDIAFTEAALFDS